MLPPTVGCLRFSSQLFKYHNIRQNKNDSPKDQLTGSTQNAHRQQSNNKERYKYHFPFLEINGIVAVDDNRVGPLYKHIFPPALAPWLSFVGLPWKSKWIAGTLCGRLSLPSPKEMMADIQAFYSSMEASGTPKRYTHNMAGYQFEYDDWLAAQCGCLRTEEWRKQMYVETSMRKRSQPETYRDQWEDEHLVR
ncbi:flavin-containing monooxygenase FMO GS-OX-like 5 [Coffea arabica]|uniref:Flavin-containing monooxygenase FMO GS-OX-like 5 n=1 Tax=Coffea arabica TaxID=13443 RepID=A0A6P6TQ41_COFAR